MSRKHNASPGHTGRTTAGNTRDVKVERIGKVTIYKRGRVYYLYFRQGASRIAGRWTATWPSPAPRPTR